MRSVFVLLWISWKTIEAEFVTIGVQGEVLGLFPTKILFHLQLEVLIWFKLGCNMRPSFILYVYPEISVTKSFLHRDPLVSPLHSIDLTVPIVVNLLHQSVRLQANVIDFFNPSQIE